MTVVTGVWPASHSVLFGCLMGLSAIACSGANDAPAVDNSTTPQPAPTTTACPEPAAPIVVPCEPAVTADSAPESAPKSMVGTTATSTGDERLTLIATDFADLPGWTDDAHADALAALLRSCEKLAELKKTDRVGSSRYAGTVEQWRPACRAGRNVKTGDHAAARRYFEAHFKAYAAHGQNGPKGKITGYYVQNLRASRTRGGAYQFPLFARPADLTSVQLSDFIADGRSRRIWGYREQATGRLLPYPKRAAIRARARVGPGTEPEPGAVLLWVDDPADALAVEIEGSGKALLPDGSTAWVAFAGKNGVRGRRSGAIMRALRKLRDRGAQGEEPDKDARVPDEAETWTDIDLEHFYTITDPREAMVFFEFEERAGAIGTQDVILSAGRSIAVDRAVIGLSTPVWISTRAPKSARGRVGPWQRLLIAQDTGGAILGSVRADIYWGDTPEARAIGRRVNGAGRMWLFLPRTLRVPTQPAPKAATKP